MNSLLTPCRSIRTAFATGSALFTASATLLHAATIWNGPVITYTQPGADPTVPANQDPLTANVVITRAATQGIFNAVTESFYTKPTSPADTEWAVGELADAASLTYTTWQGVGAGHPVLTLVGQQLVLHLITDDIYLSVKFTALGAAGGGGFSYERSSPLTAAPAPTITITNPINASVYAAPATLSISSTANVSAGSVTNVEFFVNSTSLGSVQTSPFTISSGSLPDGAYALRAIATVAGITATSAVVNITVVSPSTVTATAPGTGGGQFSFDYSVTPGLRYVVERSTNLVNWQPMATNLATSNPSHYSEGMDPDGSSYYRVGRLPNP